MFDKRISIFIFFLASLQCVAQSYFQQKTDYTISVSLNDSSHELDATERIDYTNNSPDTLHEIWFHLWPNGYADKHSAMSEQFLSQGNGNFYFADNDDLGSIDGLKFRVNDTSARYEFDARNKDICVLHLNRPLCPGRKITVTTPFHVDIPDVRFSRMGHHGQAYYITQWYPKPAVYDNNGWNTFPYLDQGEFYSEFGTFDVTLTLPQNYVVAATGDLISPLSELDWLDSIARRPLPATPSKKVTDEVIPESSVLTKTLRYHQENIHDFAWFADKTYQVRKSEVVLPSGRKVTTRVFFNNKNAKLWDKAVNYVNRSVSYYSEKVGEYPYNVCSAVENPSYGGGMEYPTITLIGDAGSALSLEEVIVHEVGHNWFYGILASNERNEPWMDEGMNSFYTQRYMMDTHPELKLYDSQGLYKWIAKLFALDKAPQQAMSDLPWLFSFLRNNDQAANLTSTAYSSLNYGSVVYMKSSMSFLWLMNSLGTAEFDKAMKQYFETWKLRHPDAKDFRKSFVSTTGKKSEWFFDDLLTSCKKPDYKICNIKKTMDPQSFTGDAWQVTIKNSGDIEGPFSVSSMIKDSIISTQWFDGFKGKRALFVHFIDFDKVRIDAGYTMLESNRKNNSIRRSGILKRMKPPAFRLFASVPHEDKTEIFFAPVIGWNKYDHFMAGIALYSSPLFPRKFDYLLMPLYSTGSKEISGSANIGYSILPRQSRIQRIRIGMYASRYHYNDYPFLMHYVKLSPEIGIDIVPKSASNRLKQHIRLRDVSLYKQSYEYVKIGEGLGDPSGLPYNIYTLERTDENYSIYELSYFIGKQTPVNPFNATATIQAGEGMAKFFVEGNYRAVYSKNKGLDIRLFYGTFLMRPTNSVYDFRFHLSGQSGYQDYMYDNIYLGRNDANIPCSNQFSETDGGFKYATAVGMTWDWLFAVNLKTSLPGKLPFKLYADFGTYRNAAHAFTGSKALSYDAGVQLSIINNIFDIYFPMLLSEDLKSAGKLFETHYPEKIRFTLNLKKLNPLELIKNPDF
ncbi:MAG: M1 family metallopeptidase [Bacteroidota bacterium]